MKTRYLLLPLITFLVSGCVAGPIETETASPSPSQQGFTSPAATTQTPDAVSESPTASSTTSPAAADQNDRLARLLAQLEIAPEYSGGYDRDLFQHWIDADSDGCNTRREVLIIEAQVSPNISSGCDLSGGKWFSWYDGLETIDPGDFDIDHLVPLKEAWESGAYGWSASTRKSFANDLAIPESLIAVSASSNRSKSDRDPAQWLPSNQNYLCEYTRAWLVVKTRWRLTVDSNEALALGSLIASCPNTEASVPPIANIAAGTPPTKSATGEDPRFDTCKEAIANGYGPYLKGQDAEYGWYRDGDKDGTVCE